MLNKYYLCNNRGGGITAIKRILSNYIIMRFLISKTIFIVAAFFVVQKASAQINNNDRFIYKTIISGGTERTFLLQLPSGYFKNTPEKYALVIGLHGGGGSGRQFAVSSGLSEKAEQEQFIMVFPDGIQRGGSIGLRTWNAGGCCGYAASTGVDDVLFISNLIDELAKNYRVNTRQVYATGHSNGGMMAYRLACELSGKITAIAPNACTMMLSVCKPGRAVPVLHIHSLLDKNVPYQGGKGVGISGVNFFPVDSGLNIWAKANNCRSEKKVTTTKGYTFTAWTDCKDSTVVLYYLTEDGGHSWPGAGRKRSRATGDPASHYIDANELVWEFFKKYSLN